MRELIIIVTILIIIIGGAIYIQHYLDRSSSKIVTELENLKEKIKLSKVNEDREDIKIEVNKIYDNWEKTEDKWAIIVFHSELDLIETSFIKMKSEIEDGDLSKSLEELETTIFLVEHISATEKFCLKNIF